MHRMLSRRLMAAIVCWPAVLAYSGCAPPDRVEQAPAAESSPSAATNREAWDVYYVQGVKVGHGVTRRSAVREGHEDLVRYEGAMQLSVSRSGEALKSEIRLGSLETRDGQVRSFESEARLGPNPIVVQGRFEAGRMHVRTTTAGQTLTGEIPWAAGDRGYFAVEASLSTRPMKPGERRTLRVLQAVFNQLADVEMVARSVEPTRLLSGTRELLRIDATTVMPGDGPIEGRKLQMVYWTNPSGDVLKSFTPTMDQVAYRATKEEALRETGGPALDLNLAAIVKLDRPLERPHEHRRIRYRVRLDGANPASVFVNDRSQRVTAVNEHTAELTVRAVRPDTPADNFAAAAPPTDDDRKSNGFIQSNDPRIVAMARAAAGDETDPWKTALLLEDFVHRKITAKNYSQAFATAAEVALSLEGDCTEHAVLLAALARARGIPARVAIGLVYGPAAPDGSGGGFLYHMWTEVFVAGGWVGLDGTLGRGGVGPAHLTLAQSNLKDATAYSSFLPVAQVLGKLKIEVLEVE